MPFPLRLYLCAVALIAGALAAAVGAWTYAFVLFGVGFGTLIALFVWWARRVNAIRSAEGLTSQDMIELTHPKWARSVATGYLAVLAAVSGGFILLAVVFVVVLVATD